MGTGDPALLLQPHGPGLPTTLQSWVPKSTSQRTAATGNCTPSPSTEEPQEPGEGGQGLSRDRWAVQAPGRESCRLRGCPACGAGAGRGWRAFRPVAHATPALEASQHPRPLQGHLSRDTPGNGSQQWSDPSRAQRQHPGNLQGPQAEFLLSCGGPGRGLTASTTLSS